MAVAGPYAYVANHDAGLQVIDISNPALPSPVATVDTSGAAYGVAVAGPYAYVADGDAGLRVIDISNPAAPSLVATVDTSGFARGVAVAGHYAYVADGVAGLQVIDISDPAVPTLVATLGISGYAFVVAVAGPYAYVAAGNGLRVIDISDPAAPTLVRTVNGSGIAFGVAVAGDHAYIADYLAGLQVIDLDIQPAVSAATDTAAITVSPVNDAPTLTATGASTTYVENAAAVDLFSAVSASTVEAGQSFTELRLTVSGLSDGALEKLLIDGTTLALTNGNAATSATNGLSLSVSLAAGTATVTASKAGGISAATLQSVIDALAYRTDSENPGTADRVVTLTRIQDDGGTANGGVDTTTLSIAATVSVERRNDAPTGGVGLSGNPVLGQALTATNTASIADADGLGPLHYTWLRNGQPIAGAADASSYTTTLLDVGAKLSVRVSWIDGGATAESLTSAASATVGMALTRPTSLPLITRSSYGSDAAEAMIGSSNSDKLDAGGGDDWLDGQGGTNYLQGGSGNDTYVVASTSDTVIERSGAGNDTVIASISYTLPSDVENLYLASSSNLNASGNNLPNLIVGNAGRNRIDGLGGNDTLIGGDGRDTFFFSTPPDSSNRDTIYNFVVADDTIELARAVFSALPAGALAAGAFVTGTRALDASDRIIFNSATGALLYDADGTGATAAVQFATLVGVVGTLTAADFVVV